MKILPMIMFMIQDMGLKEVIYMNDAIYWENDLHTLNDV